MPPVGSSSIAASPVTSMSPTADKLATPPARRVSGESLLEIVIDTDDEMEDPPQPKDQSTTSSAIDEAIRVAQDSDLTEFVVPLGNGSRLKKHDLETDWNTDSDDEEADQYIEQIGAYEENDDVEIKNDTKVVNNVRNQEEEILISPIKKKWRDSYFFRPDRMNSITETETEAELQEEELTKDNEEDAFQHFGNMSATSFIPLSPSQTVESLSNNKTQVIEELAAAMISILQDSDDEKTQESPERKVKSIQDIAKANKRFQEREKQHIPLPQRRRSSKPSWQSEDGKTSRSEALLGQNFDRALEVLERFQQSNPQDSAWMTGLDSSTDSKRRLVRSASPKSRRSSEPRTKSSKEVRKEKSTKRITRSASPRVRKTLKSSIVGTDSSKKQKQGAESPLKSPRRGRKKVSNMNPRVLQSLSPPLRVRKLDRSKLGKSSSAIDALDIEGMQKTERTKIEPLPDHIQLQNDEEDHHLPANTAGSGERRKSRSTTRTSDRKKSSRAPSGEKASQLKGDVVDKDRESTIRRKSKGKNPSKSPKRKSASNDTVTIEDKPTTPRRPSILKSKTNEASSVDSRGKNRKSRKLKKAKDDGEMGTAKQQVTSRKQSRTLQALISPTGTKPKLRIKTSRRKSSSDSKNTERSDVEKGSTNVDLQESFTRTLGFAKAMAEESDEGETDTNDLEGSFSRTLDLARAMVENEEGSTKKPKKESDNYYLKFSPVPSAKAKKQAVLPSKISSPPLVEEAVSGNESFSRTRDLAKLLLEDSSDDDK